MFRFQSTAMLYNIISYVVKEDMVPIKPVKGIGRPQEMCRWQQKIMLKVGGRLRAVRKEKTRR